MSTSGPGLATAQLPYCGPAPSPADLWTSWNLDPVLIGMLVAVAAAYRWAQQRVASRSAMPAHRGWCFQAGWAIAALALVSPLCALSVALFSARVGQHMVLVLIAAPLVALGRPSSLLRAMVAAPNAGVRDEEQHAMRHRLAAWLCFTGSLWFWHAPAPYAASFGNTAVYWAMHISLFGSAVVLWHTLLNAGGAQRALSLGWSLASSAQMGMLGALLTFAPRSLYPMHAVSAPVWQLSALEDQQLGGLLMWVPGCLLLLIAGIAALHAGWRALEPNASS